MLVFGTPILLIKKGSSPYLFVFEEFIEARNIELSQHKAFFQNLRKSGGTIDYFVGWFSVDL